MVYLDNASTTKIRKEVIDEMMPFLTDIYGNPTAKYYEQAIKAKNAVELSRNRVAKLLNCRTDEVIFTSGSTEGNNMVIKGVADYYRIKGNHIITTKIEHASVLESCKYLESKGFEVTYLDVDHKGLINLEQLTDSIKKETILVSVMWVNNEIGTINDIKKIAQICAQKGVFFHTDATQAIGKVDIDFDQLKGVNFLTFSGHKIYGPKGIGATIIRKDLLGLDIKLTPLLHGGEQEFGYRSGTLPVHNIVGIGIACEIITKELNNQKKELRIKHKVIEELIRGYFGSKVKLINDFDEKIDGIVSLQFIDVNNQILLKNLSNMIAASTGSSCSVNNPSYVLKAIGKSEREIRQIIRFSFSHDINIKCFEEVLKEI